MSITEIGQVSWFTRIKDAFVGIFVGGAMFVGSFILLFWNEGRAVKTAQSLEEGAKAVISADASAVDPAKEGKLIHLTGTADATAPLSDPDFGVSARALRLKRVVEMYQWDEVKDTKTTKNVGGSQTTQTTYSYKKVWADHPIASSGFKESGHQNPESMPAKSSSWNAPNAVIGAYALTSGLLDQLSSFSPLTLDAAAAARAAAAPSGPWRENQGGLYRGANPADAQVGDLRTTFLQVPSMQVSLVSQQAGHSFQPFHTHAGRDVEILVTGSHGADEMFADAEKSNSVLTWVLRGVGWLVMFIGLVLIMKPLAILADVIPFLGSIVGAGEAIVAGLLSVFLSLVVIAVAWIAYRPLIGIALLIAAVAAGVSIRSRIAASPARRAAVPAA
jgi:hypothetical protein